MNMVNRFTKSYILATSNFDLIYEMEDVEKNLDKQ